MEHFLQSSTDNSIFILILFFRKMNIVDTMFKMLEKYSNDLEELVKDRTDALAEEKKKTEHLISRMLPV